jgi:hypothetical protein
MESLRADFVAIREVLEEPVVLPEAAEEQSTLF